MKRPEPRPVPESIVVVAFPQAYRQNAQWAAQAVQDAFVVMAESRDVDVQPAAADWLSLSAPERLAPGVSKVPYQATANTRLGRAVTVALRVNGAPYHIEFVQQGGYLTQDELIRALNAPLTVDFLVAVTFIAQQIKKISPPPIKYVVLLIAVVAIIALGFAISAARHAFIDVPEPKPLSTDTNGVPLALIPMPGARIPYAVFPFNGLAAEDQLILLQTVQQVYWLVRQTL